MSTGFVPEDFTEDERRVLAPFFTNIDRPVFALLNLPEVVKGALFARYSRSAKSLRRLFLDEFAAEVAADHVLKAVGTARADRLYEKVFLEYGDDSVAQLGGVHLACENASNILTKILERGRLMSYLEQSTRYVPYTQKPAGRWKYVKPPELDDHPELGERFDSLMDLLFETYRDLLERMQEWFREESPAGADESPGAWRRAIRAKALDTVRGLLPAATRSNLGIYGTGQAFEALLLRMRAHPLREARETADAMLEELRKVIPAFLARVDRPERGVATSRYLEETLAATRRAATGLGRLGRLDRMESEMPPETEVTLTDFDPEGEIKVAAAALYPVTDLSDSVLLDRTRRMFPGERERILAAAVGDRKNRRHRPGRAFERTSYRFDILSDYGAFRDLQRHRILTIEWQPLTADHGYLVPPEVCAAGHGATFTRVMEEAKALYGEIAERVHPDVASYAVPMAYRIRYVMEMNAREAMHVIELRTSPQGHASYRRVCQAMHRLIRDEAGHPGIAAAIGFANHETVDLGRLAAERRTESRRRARGQEEGS